MAENGPYTIRDLFAARKTSFLGFCEVEKDQGGIDLSVNISMPDGQRNARDLYARTVEELLEAFDSHEPAHMREELIDSLNFATGIIYLGGISESTEAHLISELESIFSVDQVIYKGSSYLTKSDIGQGANSFSSFLEKLRNRTWQHSVQHPYFMGEKELVKSLVKFWLFIAMHFQNYEEFSHYFMAKDAVLKFRLETKY